jgi:hypothetical protein
MTPDEAVPPTTACQQPEQHSQAAAAQAEDTKGLLGYALMQERRCGLRSSKAVVYGSRSASGWLVLKGD